MAFKRRETVIEAVDLSAISPEEAQTRLIAGVKKYATNEANYSKADANTPYLGHVIGMGIESSNLADITLSIERQFLTRKTRRVPLAEGSSEFRLEDGELGKLRILEGQDALAATPGLCLKMLMDLGHMPKSPAYLQTVVSFAYITALGDGYRMNDSARKALARIEKLSGPERAEAAANLTAMAQAASAYEKQLADPQALAASRRKTYESDKTAYETLSRELDMAAHKLKGLTASNDHSQISALRAQEAEIKTRLKMSASKLRVSEELARDAERRSPLEEAKASELRRLLAETAAQAERAAA